jgi:hypothetical protein
MALAHQSGWTAIQMCKQTYKQCLKVQPTPLARRHAFMLVFVRALVAGSWQVVASRWKWNGTGSLCPKRMGARRRSRAAGWIDGAFCLFRSETNPLPAPRWWQQAARKSKGDSERDGGLRCVQGDATKRAPRRRSRPSMLLSQVPIPIRAVCLFRLRGALAWTLLPPSSSPDKFHWKGSDMFKFVEVLKLLCARIVCLQGMVPYWLSLSPVCRAGAGFWQWVFKVKKIQIMRGFVNCYALHFILMVAHLLNHKIWRVVFKMIRKKIIFNKVIWKIL